MTFGKAFGNPGETIEIEWPANWRLPVVGEGVILSKDRAGIIREIDWDFEHKVMIVTFR